MPTSGNNYEELLANGDMTGEIKVDHSPMHEIGDTGLKRSAGIIDEEFLPALRGRKAIKVYQEMSLNDPVVGSLLFAIEQLLRQVEWTVVCEDNSPEGEQATQFVEECMNDMSHTWDDMVAEALSFITYGWSWHEVVYKKRVGPWESDPRRKSKYTDGKFGWRKIPIRSQETLQRWIFDEDGGIRAMVQMPPPHYSQRVIPIERSLLFRGKQSKGNPEGVSMLRNAYRPWFFKKRLEEFEAIGVERDLAGMPMARVPSDYIKAKKGTDKQRTYEAFKKMVKNVRRDEHEGLVIPREFDPDTKQDLFDFELLSTGGGRTFDTNALISRYEQRILMTVLADFIMLGQTQTGSYAMHVDKTGIFRAALNTMANVIADTFNRHAIPRLFEMNAWKPQHLPTIKPSNVDPPNLTELSSFMSTMAGLGMQFFPDPDLEKMLRDTAHLPEIPEEQMEMRRQMANQQQMATMMESAMQTSGMAQKQQMVEQGMTPEQAEMASQQQTPEMMEQEQTGQMVAQSRAQMNPEVMQAQQTQQEMELGNEQQRMELSRDPRQEEDQERQMQYDAAMKDKEFEHTSAMKDLERTSKEKELSLKEKEMEMRLKERIAAAKQRGKPSGLKEKPEPRGQNNVSRYTSSKPQPKRELTPRRIKEEDPMRESYDEISEYFRRGTGRR